MMISPSARALFVHVQKSGGSTIDHVMQAVLPDAGRVPGLSRHAPLAEILGADPGLSTHWIFGFVRNPWARMYSWHAMIDRARVGAAANDPVLSRRLSRNRVWRTVVADYPDFESFVMRAPDEITWLRRPQISYLRTPTRAADFIGRQERFEDDMRVVLDRLGVEWPGDIPRQNAAGAEHRYRDAFSPAMRDRVAQMFAEDIRLFDYEF